MLIDDDEVSRGRRLDAEAPVSLAALLQNIAIPKTGLTISQLDDQFGLQAAPLLMVFLSAPFLFPMPIPGISTLCGIAIVYLAIRLRWSSLHLPAWLGRRTVDEPGLRRMIDKSLPMIIRLESFGRYHRAPLFLKLGLNCTTTLIILAAILLAIPIPPVIPFTNTLPAIAIILLSFGWLRQDGALILAGLVFFLAACLYFVIIGYSVIYAGNWLAEQLFL